MSEEIAGGSPAVLRQLNTRMLLRTIREHGALSRVELHRLTELSRPTIQEVVGDLLAAGYLVEQAENEDNRARRPGPRARLLRLRAEMAHIVGIDVGADKAVVKVADLDGTECASVRLSTRRLRRRSVIVSRLRDGLAQALAKADTSHDRLCAAVVGTPGIVDPATETVSVAPQLEGWEGFPLARELLGDLDCPVVAENEMDLAVLGEHWRGAAAGIDDVVYIGLGVGIGAGILIGGNIHRGATGTAGEIGYLPLVQPSTQAGPGVAGAFEAAAGADAFARAGRQAAERHSASELCTLAGRDPAAVRAETVFAAAHLGDPTAVGVVAELTDLLARGIASVCLVLDPPLVVLGGGLSRGGSTLLDPLRRSLATYLPAAQPRLVCSSLGDEATAIGALYRAMQLSDERLYALAIDGGRS